MAVVRVEANSQAGVPFVPSNLARYTVTIHRPPPPPGLMHRFLMCLCILVYLLFFMVYRFFMCLCILVYLLFFMVHRFLMCLCILVYLLFFYDA